MKVSVSNIVSQFLDQIAFAIVESFAIDKTPIPLIQRERILLADRLVARTIPCDKAKLRIVVDSYHVDTRSGMCMTKYAKEKDARPCVPTALPTSETCKSCLRYLPSFGPAIPVLRKRYGTFELQAGEHETVWPHVGESAVV